MRILKVNITDPKQCILIKGVDDDHEDVLIFNPGVMQVFYEPDPPEESEERKKMNRLIELLCGMKP